MVTDAEHCLERKRNTHGARETPSPYGRLGWKKDYKAARGVEAAGSKDDRKQKWLKVVRDLYKKAWRSGRNELIEMWVKEHLE